VFNANRDVHTEQDDMGEPWEVYEIRTYSLGLQDDISLGESFSLLTGANLAIFDQARTFTGSTGENIYSFNPVVAVNHNLGLDTLLYASVSKRTNFPNMNQLYSSTSGNPDLEEQVNINCDVGIKHDIKDSTSIEVNYFYNHVKDLIDRASKDDPFLNISKAIFQGLDTNLGVKISEDLYGKLSYSYVYARDKNPGIFGRSDEELANVPEHKADIEIGFKTDFGLSLSVLGSYNGRRYYYDSSDNQHALGSYYVCNAKVEQKLIKGISVSLYAENIFDRNYHEEEGYPQPGRRIFFKLKTSL
jgi:outer membrane cobalamin receptor